MKLIKYKLATIISATSLATGAMFLPMILNNVSQNIPNIQNTNSQTDLQVVNSVDEINVENAGLNDHFGQAIVKINGIQNLYVWGRNDSGELGVGDKLPRWSPVKVELPIFGTDTVIKYVNNYAYASYAILETNGIEEIYVWGSNAYGQLGLGDTLFFPLPTKFTPPSAFADGKIRKIVFSVSSYAIIDKADNRTDIYVWGNNQFGQLGLGHTTDQPLPTLLPLSRTMAGWNFKSDGIFDSASYAVRALYEKDGVSRLYVWGYNPYDQLGLNNAKTDVTTPQLIPSSNFSNGRIISFKYEHFYASWALVEVAGQKRVYICGWNAKNQLGLNLDPVSVPTLGTHTPIPASYFGNGEVMEMGSYGSVRASMYAIVKINNVSRIYTWGSNLHGETGNDGNTNVKIPYAIPTARFNDGIIESYHFASCGAIVSARVNNKQQIFVWGENVKGGLGMNHTTRIMIPTRLNNPLFEESDINISKVSLIYLMFSLQKDGKKQFYISGANDYGALGDGTTIDKWGHIPILPSTFTKSATNDSATAIKLKRSVSATDAMQSIKSNNIHSRSTLEKYVDLTSFPKTAILSVDTNKSKVNYGQNTIDLVINSTSHYVPLQVLPVEENKQFSIKIDGFREVKDFPIITKTSPILAATDFFSKAIVDNETNRDFLEQYLDLSCIPADAEIKIEPLDLANTSKIKFLLKTNKVYSDNGKTTLGDHQQLFDFDTTPKGLDPAIIVGLIVGGIVLLAAVFVIVHISHKRIVVE